VSTAIATLPRRAAAARLAALAAFAAACFAAPAAHARNPADWISIAQAVQIAKQQVSAVTPIKAELDDDSGWLSYEVKAFKYSTLYEIRIDPLTGQVFDVDTSTGGGAQSKIAEAQDILGQSIYTLQQAINVAGQLYPNYQLVEIEMRYRNGVPIFDMEFVRGMYRLQVYMRVTDGAVIRQSTHLLSSGSGYYNLHLPDDGGAVPSWDTSQLWSAPSIINDAQGRFGGRVFEIQLKQVSSTGYRYELRLRKGTLVIRAKYNARTGALLSTKTISDDQYVKRVRTAMNNASISLNQAINKAKAAVPGGFVTEAKLHLSSEGARYEVTFLTSAGLVMVRVNSATGAIISYRYTS
jgi:uncharacterized membrane protein YkoI